MNNVSVEISRDNYKILKIVKGSKNIYIGSKYNQKREVEKFVNSFDSFTENDIYIIFGAACLEHIVELKKINKNFKKIIIVEVNNEINDFIINDKALNEIFFDKRISVVKNIEEMNQFFEQEINDMNINFVKIGYYSNYDKIYSLELKDMIKYIKDISHSILSNRNTNIHFGETWFNSLIENLKYMKKSTPINYIKNKFKNKPAIIVSAGPSLSKNIKKLKGINNALILSGGRTLNTLLENNIKIDYLGIVDPGEISYKLVEKNIKKCKIPLVYYNGTNSKVLKNHNGKKIFCTDNDFIKKIFEEDIIHLGGAGSVAHFLTNFAIYSGCNPIIFVGQDLAYTNDKLHDERATHQYKTDNKAWENKTDLYVDDINGEKVRTSVILNDFKLGFEKIVKLNPEIKFINATEGGANIKGTEIKTLEETLNDISSKANDFDFEERYINITGFNKKIKEFIDVCVELNKKTELGIKLIDKLNKALNSNYKIHTYLSDLDKVDSSINKNIERLAIFQNKIFANMYEINNSLNFVICSNDSRDIKRRKNLAKNKAIYMTLNIHSKEIKEKLEELLKDN